MAVPPTNIAFSAMVRTLLGTTLARANASSIVRRCPKRFCALKLLSGELYLRSPGCSLRKPGWNLFLAMALAATALKDADPLPDVELCLHESSRALAIDGWKGYSARGAPI